MNNILKKLVIFIFINSDFIQIRSCCDNNIFGDCSLLEIEYKKFVDLCLEIWTKIDLIKAIDVNDEQKNFFLSEVIQDIVNVTNQIEKFNIKSCLNKINYNFDHSISLINELKENFEEAFFTIASSGEFISGYTLLSQVVESLEMPTEIQC